jgi:transcriptional regulator GlxA family with amidase domain
MPSCTDQRYRTIVDRVNTIAHLHAGEPLHIRFLCQTCGVTDRTLRNAFQSVYGKTPYRYLRETRMLEARQALLRARTSETVTSIATQHGFLELGRFSVEYRSVFGECPSETLRRARLENGSQTSYRHRAGILDAVHVTAA